MREIKLQDSKTVVSYTTNVPQKGIKIIIVWSLFVIRMYKGKTRRVKKNT